MRSFSQTPTNNATKAAKTATKAAKQPQKKKKTVAAVYVKPVVEAPEPKPVTLTASGLITHEGRRDTPYPYDHPLFSKEASLPRGYLHPDRKKKDIIPLEDRVDLRPEDLTIETPVTNLKGEEKGIVLLNHRIFDAPIRPDVVHQVIVWQLARRRAGTGCTKTRATVNYSRRKIYKQKGTGNARHGSRGAPIFRGGGRAHGKIPRSFDFKLNTQFKKMAMRSVLSSKKKTNKLFIVDDMEIDEPKTKAAAQILKQNEWEGKRVLYYFWDVEANLERATSNIDTFERKHVKAISAYDILRNEYLFINKKALHYLTMRYAPR